MDGLRGRESSGVWHHGGPEHRRTINRHWGLVRQSMRMAKKEENASDNRLRKREAEKANKVEVAPGVTVVSLRHETRDVLETCWLDRLKDSRTPQAESAAWGPENPESAV